MEAMTLERATEFMRLVDNGQISGRISEWPGLRQACGVVYAHLAQPAQAVDVWAVLVELRAAADQDGATMGQCFQWWRLLTRALSGEKAGPVGDGWTARRDDERRLWWVYSPSGVAAGIYDQAAGVHAELLRQLAKELAATPSQRAEG